MEVAVTTDVGSGQRLNDDAWCHEQLHRNVTLLAVADGFGRPHGVPAAAIVLDSIRDVIRQELRRATFPSRPLSPTDIRDLITLAFAHGNERLLQLGGGNDDRVAAGSTCTLVLIVSNQAFVGHVGDSRAYLLRRGELVQLTTDESLLQDLVRSGATHGEPQPRRLPTLLTRALGVEPAAAVPPKIAHYTLHAHDSVLLCTDGISQAVGFAETQSAVMTRESAASAAERILALARNAGSTDNATVLLARNATVHGSPAGSTPVRARPPVAWLVALALSLALFSAAGLSFRALWLGDDHLYLAQDSAGDVGLFTGSTGSLFGIPLRFERQAYDLPVAKLSADDRQRFAQGVIPVVTTDAANAIVDRWLARTSP
jgi:PPM family protein phosphatase